MSPRRRRDRGGPPSPAAPPRLADAADALPIEAIRQEFEAIRAAGRPLVVRAETGSGKSTQVPRWCRDAGRVLVVEPRRVACRSLARWVSGLEGTALGEGVGYAHRNEEVASARTGILFVTPGVALRMAAEDDIDRFATVVLDEFHERGQQTDLLLALQRQRRDRQGLVVMSATLETGPLARYLDGEVLTASGRVHPVGVEYTGCSLLPDPRGLARRVRAGVERALAGEGDVLVFLPGTREIEECMAACSGLPGVECLPLHGTLSSSRQDQAFTPGDRRRVILATNVAETSVTLPRIGAVVDSGLVRRTLYRWGASSLGLVAVARDSAEQRRGRAGRLGPGRCVRLWSEAAILEPVTPPALHREPLEDLILQAGCCGVRLGELDMLDPPQPYALEHSLGELAHMGAVDEAGHLTAKGRRMSRLPLSPFLASLVDECCERPLAAAAVDLAALFSGPPVPLEPGRVAELTEEPCDAAVALALMRAPEPPVGERGARLLCDARATARRLRRQLSLPPPGEDEAAGLDREALAQAAIRAHPRMAFVRRPRGRSFTNGGSEVRLDPRSVVEEDTLAMVVLGLRAREGRRGTEVLATAAVPCTPSLLARAGLGRARLGGVERGGGRIQVMRQTVYARQVLTEEECEPTGEELHRTVATLVLRGSLHRGLAPRIEEGLRLLALDAALRQDEAPARATEEWLAERLATLGVEVQEDLGLLEPDDLLPEELPARRREELDTSFPPEVATPQGTYPVQYDVAGRRVVMVAPKRLVGKRVDPHLLPPWRGFRVVLREHDRERELRGRGGSRP